MESWCRAAWWFLGREWAPGDAAPPVRPSRMWPAVTVGATTAAAPTDSPAEVFAAHQKFCDAYKLAIRAVQIETNGNSPERAGNATVNGAVHLERVPSAYVQ
ncbi:hypothetical protein MMAN_39680 [Mycobacterium mantenii]|uniref:Uncharacterized protein n=1 Tax=Mycobacterium mantenii TaxID=560555 RepID=A0ABN6AGQ1_MYCNT|nr:hypothetical protein MMAN_39680 [Mycobacterium mantenii]